MTATPRHLAFCAFRAGSLHDLVCVLDPRAPGGFLFRASFGSFPRACQFARRRAAHLATTIPVTRLGDRTIVEVPVALRRHTRLPALHQRIKIQGLNVRALHATLQRAGYHRRRG